MKTFLIDPTTRKVSEVDYDGDFRKIYELIDCRMFTCVYPKGWPDGSVLFLDDEGLFVEGQTFFILEGYPQPLAGKALVMGTDEEGESMDAPVSLALLKTPNLIRWCDRNTAALYAKMGFFDTTVTSWDGDGGVAETKKLTDGDKLFNG